MKKLLFLLVVGSLPIMTSAYNAKIDGIYYNLNFDTKTATVTYTYTVYAAHEYVSDYSGEIVIPNEVIWNDISYSVTEIDQHAFTECGSMTSVKIGDNVQTIGAYAFVDCKGLTSIVIPDGVKSIGDGAFAGCSGLTDLTIPSSVTSIGRRAFSSCCGLTSVNIPNGIKNINDELFQNCEQLVSIEIPNSVTSIGSAAFQNCTRLTSITIPGSVTNFLPTALYGCCNLTSIVVEGNNAVYDSRDYCNAIIETSTNTLICGCKTTTIPNSVTSIGDIAFSGCTSLTSVVIPNSVVRIGEDAFRGTGLTSVTIPSSVTLIEWFAFGDCSSLKSVSIPNSVTSISAFTFQNCSSLNTITIPNSVISIEPFAFHNCSGLTSVTIPESVTYIGNNAFENCSELKDIYIYSGKMPIIDDYSFKDVPTENAALHVPSSLIETYKETLPYEFGTIIALPQINYIVDGKLYKASIFPSGDAVIAEPEPARKGFTFSGWSEIPTIMPSEDWNVIGTFIRNKYILTYEVEGEEYGTHEIEYQAVIIEEKAPEKEGYTFSGWQGLPKTMPAEDIIARGSFTINKYKLTYKVDDKEYKFYEIEYGTSPIAEGEPSKDGYTFSGWSEIPTTMPAKDVIVEGVFIPKKYTLTYIVDGETYKTHEMDCGAPLSIEPEPMKEGYTFSGWSEIPATMPARNLSIMGAFIQADDIQEIIEDADTYQIYTIDGMPIEALQKGVNIIRMSDGTIKKVFVK